MAKATDVTTNTPQFATTDDALDSVLENIAPQAPQVSPTGYERSNEQLTSPDDISGIILKLEEERDRKAGITRKIVDGVLIRDARNVHEQPERGTEAFEMNYLNAARAAVEVMKMEGKGEEEQMIVMQEAEQFLQNFHKKNKNKSQEEIGEAFAQERDKLVAITEQAGIKKAYKKINTAANYQGLNDKTYAISTLVNDGGNTYEMTSVPKTQLTNAQKHEFEHAKQWNGKPRPALATMPKWFQTLSDTEKDLCAKYADKIIAGHMIPTQLVNIPGMRNSYETVTRVHQAGKKPQIVSRNFHSGTVACLGKDEEESVRLTKQNMEQAATLAGVEPGQMHYNTLNAEMNKSGKDPLVVRRTRKAAQASEVGASHTNTCFNIFRVFGASQYGGVKKDLKKFITTDVSDLKISSDAKKAIKAHLTPRGAIKRLFGRGKPKMSLEDAMAGLSDAQKNTITIGAELAEKLGKTRLRGRDRENLDLQINENIAAFSNGLREAGFQTKLVHHTECKSGKDRTGLAILNMAVNAIKRLTGNKIQDLDKIMLRGGHTAHMAGGITSGGGGIGCMGTKSENKAGIPKSRKESLDAIMESASKYNKVEKPKKKPKARYQLNARYQQRYKQRQADRGRGGGAGEGARASVGVGVGTKHRSRAAAMCQGFKHQKTRTATTARGTGGRAQQAGIGM